MIGPRSRVSSVYLLYLSLLGSIVQAQQSATGAVAGMLTTQDGKSVVATVRARKSNPYPPSPSVRVTTGNGGAFQIGGLASGPWQLCAAVTGGDYIDECLWGTSGVTVNVQPGKTTSGIALQVKKASGVQVRINDPQGLASAGSANRYLVLGVMGPGGHFHALRRRSADATGVNYQLDVPYEKPFRMLLRGVGLSVADSANNAVPAAGLSVPLLYSSTAPAAPVLTFTVTGAH